MTHSLVSRLRAERRGPARSLLLRAVAISLLLSVAAAVPPAPGAFAVDGQRYTGAFVYGGPDASIAQGSLVNLVPPDYELVDYFSTAERVSIRASSQISGLLPWSFEFAAPAGESIAVGTYTDARNPYLARPPGVPGIKVSGNGRGCNEPYGDFTIDELQRDASGKVVVLSARFEQRCFDSTRTGPTLGEIRLDSTRPWAGWSMDTHPFSAFAYGNVVVGSTSAAKYVTVANTGAEPIWISADIVGEHPNQFALIGAGCLGQLAPGTSCTFGVVFAPTSKAARTAQLAIHSSVYDATRYVALSGTGVHPSPTLSIQVVPNPALPGEQLTITVSANPVPDGGLIWLSYGSPTLINKSLGSRSVGGAHGGQVTFSATFGPGEGLALLAWFSGTAQFDPAESPVFIRSEAQDLQPPVVAAPSVALRSGKTSGSGVPVQVSWPAATDNSSGVSRYQLQHRVDGGAWSTVTLSADLVTSHALKLVKGSNHAFRLRARDNAGNWSGWATGPTVRSLIRQERHASISYSGSWPRKSLTGAWGGYVKRAAATGARASITFTGRSVGWVTTKAPKRGQARIYVDGVLATTIDLYAAQRSPRELVWQRSWEGAGTHTIEVRVVGTTDRPAIDIDAFVLLAAP